MTKITIIEHSGISHVIETQVGHSIMQTVVDHMIPGILADCGGTCSCATCHAYVDPRWVERIQPPCENEQIMLEGVIGQRPNSRLTCQLVVGPEMDGLILQLPASQC